MVTKTVSIKKSCGQWRVRWSEAGKDKSARHETKDEAEAHAAELRSQKETRGEVWLSLSAYDRNNLIAAYTEARRLGIDIHKAIQSASQNGHASKSIGIAKLIEELKTTKLSSGKDPGYVKNLGIVLNQFAVGRESMTIDKVTLADVETFLHSKKLNYRPTVRGKLSTMFNYAVRRGYRLDNPCTRLEPFKIIRNPPEIFTAAQFKTAVQWLRAHRPEGLAWFALATVCGLRPEEAEKTTKTDIHFKEGFVKVEAQTTKVRQRRVVYPKAEAMAFLKRACKRGLLPLGQPTRRNIISGGRRPLKSLRHALGFKVWPKDITRHTAASYWLASGVSAGIVSEMLGNSEKVLKRDYKALVTKKEAEEFWEVVKGLSETR